jgi:hypothetical protein
MSKAGDIGVTMMMKTVPVRDSVGHASTRNIVERKVWATVAAIAVCADNRKHCASLAGFVVHSPRLA